MKGNVYTTAMLLILLEKKTRRLKPLRAIDFLTVFIIHFIKHCFIITLFKIYYVI